MAETIPVNLDGISVHAVGPACTTFSGYVHAELGFAAERIRAAE